jgi:hypothetical protein
MPMVTWDHVHLRSPDPEATAAWLENILGGVINRGPTLIVKLGGANIFIAPVAAGDGVNGPPVTPYQGLDHFGLAVVSRSNCWSATRNTYDEGRPRAVRSREDRGQPVALTLWGPIWHNRFPHPPGRIW